VTAVVLSVVAGTVAGGSGVVAAAGDAGPPGTCGDVGRLTTAGGPTAGATAASGGLPDVAPPAESPGDVGLSAALGGGTPTADAGATASARERSGFSGRIDLGDADTTLSGAAANDSVGRAVAAAGDVNGDGVDDVVVGAPGNDRRATNAGAVFLFYGPVDAGDLTVDDADVALYGVAKNDRAGTAVSTAGDLDGDGYDDVVIGAPFSDISGKNGGAAYVLFGDDDLPKRASLADADVTMYGGVDDRVGWDVSNTTAFRNGEPGVIVGAPRDNAGGADAGAAFLVAGDTLAQSSDVDLESESEAKLVGESRVDHAGHAVSNAGDVDGDGYDDVVVGAPDNDSAGEDSGAAYVVYGPVDGDVRLEDADVRLGGVAAGDRAGKAVSNAGDLDDDGIDDVVVGAPYNDSAGSAAGEAYVVFGSDSLPATASLADADLTLRGAAEGDRAGWSVAAAGSGDVTCDEVDDLLVGAPGNDTAADDAGAAYLVAGDDSLSGTRSLDTSQATFVGESENDSAGFAVSAAGDVDDDGDEDVLVGSPDRDATSKHDVAKDAGAAYVLLADCPSPAETADPVDVDTKCDDGQGVIRVENENDETTVEVEITGPDDFERTVTLDPGERKTFRHLDDGEYDVKTFVDGDRIGKDSVDIDCEEELEELEVRTDCGRDGGKLEVENPNDVSVVVKVDGPGRPVTFELGAGESERLTGLDDGEYEIRAETEDSGRHVDVEDSRVEIDCEEELEELQVRTDCGRDGGKLEVQNPNDVAVVVKVSGPDGATQFQLGPGEAERLTELADGDYRIRSQTVDSGEEVDVEDSRVEIDCEEELEALTVRTDCGRDGGKLEVENPNDVSVVVKVSGPDGATQFQLDPGEAERLTELADGDYRIRSQTVDSGEEVEVDDSRVEIDCEEELEALTVRTDCGRDGGKLEVQNPNDVAVVVKVSGPDGATQFQLGPGEAERLTELADGDYRVRSQTVDSGEEVEVDDSRVEIDCEEELEALTVRTDCGRDGGKLEVQNPNDVSVVVKVSGPDGATQFQLDPGEANRLTELADGDYRVRSQTVDSGEEVDVEDSRVEIDCEETDDDASLSALTVRTDCGSDGGKLEVENPNDVAVEVRVVGPGAPTEFELGPGEAERLTGLPDRAYPIRAQTVDSGEDVEVEGSPVKIDCRNPGRD
jgi:hypothetical protein